MLKLKERQSNRNHKNNQKHRSKTEIVMKKKFFISYISLRPEPTDLESLLSTLKSPTEDSSAISSELHFLAITVVSNGSNFNIFLALCT